MARNSDRNPDMYSIGVPQILFSPLPTNGDLKYWADSKALISAFLGLTDNNGYVTNNFGNAVGTPADIRHNCYLGALDTASLGGDVEELEHTVSNLGYEETDRLVVLQRPLNYTLSFDEPDIKNLCRFMVAQEAETGLALRQLSVTGKTFQGSGSPVVSVVDHTIGDPALAVETVMSLWLSEGGTGNPPDGTYGFIIGGDNTVDCEGEWANKRQWIAYADFDFGAKSHTSWSYIRPQGTTLAGSGDGTPIIAINSAIQSIPDSEPVLNKCGATYQWNATSSLAWTGYGWFGSDEGFFGYTIVGATRAFKRTNGCAVVATLTEIGVSTVHVIPRATMMPEGNLDFSADAWVRGSFNLQVLRDAKAKMFDRSPALAIPFGFVQSFRLPDTVD